MRKRMAVMSIIAMIYFTLFSLFFFGFHIVTWICIVFDIAIIIMTFVPVPSNIVLKNSISIRIDLNKNIISSKWSKNKAEKSLSIKSKTRIYDYGEWYLIKGLVIEKKLLVNGNLNDFEFKYKNRIKHKK
jgi:hypothetical protein